MTSPDSYFPDTAINASSGFAAYTRKTEADYRAEMHATQSDHWSGAEAGFFAFLSLLNGIIDTIEGVFKGIPIVGQLVQPVFDFVDSILGQVHTAQSTGDTAMSQIAAIWANIRAHAIPGGASIVEDFNGIASSTLPDRFIQDYFGPGNGNEGIDGHGNAHWTADGALGRGCYNHHTSELNTDNQVAYMSVRGSLVATGNGSPQLRMHLRGNEARDAHVDARLERNYDGSGIAVLGCTVGGTFTQFGDAVVGFGMSDGDLYEFRAGTDTDIREFELLRNGVTIISRTDTDDVSQYGVDYRHPGFTTYAGVNFVFFYYQEAPPDVSTFAAADRSTGLS